MIKTILAAKADEDCRTAANLCSPYFRRKMSWSQTLVGMPTAPFFYIGGDKKESN